MKHFITQSLLSAWQYMFDCHEDYSEEAKDSFMKTLRREPTERTEAMQRGIDFENEVLACCDNPAEVYSATVEEIADRVRGGAWQATAYMDRTVDGVDFLLYAKSDFVKAGVIYDVKRVQNYDVGKYISSPQHPMYFACMPGAVKFIYLISDGANKYEEPYYPAETESIDTFIRHFMAFLKAENLWGLYEEKWKA